MDQPAVEAVTLSDGTEVRFRDSGTLREKKFTEKDWDDAPGEVISVEGVPRKEDSHS